MIKNANIFSLLDKIQQRTSMFIPDKSIISLQTFLSGYESCMQVHGMIEQDVPDFKHFSEWLSCRVDWGLSYGWARAIYENTADHQQDLQIFFELISEFRKLHPKTIKNVKFGPNHPLSGEKILFGDGSTLLRLEKLQVIHYVPEELFFLRFFYLMNIENGHILFSSLKDAINWAQEEFPISASQWRNGSGEN